SPACTGCAVAGSQAACDAARAPAGEPDTASITSWIADESLPWNTQRVSVPDADGKLTPSAASSCAPESRLHTTVLAGGWGGLARRPPLFGCVVVVVDGSGHSVVVDPPAAKLAAPSGADDRALSPHATRSDATSTAAEARQIHRIRARSSKGHQGTVRRRRTLTRTGRVPGGTLPVQDGSCRLAYAPRPSSTRSVKAAVPVVPVRVRWKPPRLPDSLYMPETFSG